MAIKDRGGGPQSADGGTRKMPLEMLDTTSVEDVFATTTRIENAGGGCIRIYNCIIKNDMLIPVGNAVVFPASSILRLAETAQDFARRLVLVELDGSTAH